MSEIKNGMSGLYDKVSKFEGFGFKRLMLSECEGFDEGTSLAFGD